jgi:hypothetical protein
MVADGRVRLKSNFRKGAKMPLKFEKRKIGDERYESAGVFDVDGDGLPDIVSGAWWYRGPDFEERFPIGEVRAEGEYYDDFSTVPMEIAGSGRTDFVTGGWWGNTLRWRENPGEAGREWPEHVIAEVGNVETTRAWDVDGDGEFEIVPNTPGGPLVAYKLVAPGNFEAHEIWKGPQGHGLGFGDVSGNGRGDFVLRGGWLEAPEDAWGGEWKFHADFDLGSASIPIIVADVNGDGLSDLIVGQSHAYGLDWWEQRGGTGGARTWTRHPIDPFCSQYHDMFWLDIDGDGEPELVTGKRWRAHCGKDPGADDPVGIYYFKWAGEGFAKQVIDYGDAADGGGCGIHFGIADLTGDGRPDIVAPGKDGLFLYFNRGK